MKSHASWTSQSHTKKNLVLSLLHALLWNEGCLFMHVIMMHELISPAEFPPHTLTAAGRYWTAGYPIFSVLLSVSHARKTVSVKKEKRKRSMPEPERHSRAGCGYFQDSILDLKRREREKKTKKKPCDLIQRSCENIDCNSSCSRKRKLSRWSWRWLRL